MKPAELAHMGKRSCAAAVSRPPTGVAATPRQPCNSGMLRMFHKSRKFSNSWSCHRITTVLSCHSETGAHTGRGNPFPKVPSEEGAPPEGLWGILCTEVASPVGNGFIRSTPTAVILSEAQRSRRILAPSCCEDPSTGYARSR